MSGSFILSVNKEGCDSLTGDTPQQFETIIYQIENEIYIL